MFSYSHEVDPYLVCQNAFGHDVAQHRSLRKEFSPGVDGNVAESVQSEFEYGRVCHGVRLGLSRGLLARSLSVSQCGCVSLMFATCGTIAGALR